MIAAAVLALAVLGGMIWSAKRGERHGQDKAVRDIQDDAAEAQRRADEVLAEGKESRSAFARRKRAEAAARDRLRDRP